MQYKGGGTRRNWELIRGGGRHFWKGILTPPRQPSHGGRAHTVVSVSQLPPPSDLCGKAAAAFVLNSAAAAASSRGPFSSTASTWGSVEGVESVTWGTASNTNTTPYLALTGSSSPSSPFLPAATPVYTWVTLPPPTPVHTWAQATWSPGRLAPSTSCRAPALAVKEEGGRENARAC